MGINLYEVSWRRIYVHLRAQFLSPFHCFFSFFSCNPRLIDPSTPMSKQYSVHIHLLNPLPVPFVFYIVVNGDRKLTNMVFFFSNCSGLLKCLKQGSRQFTTIFTTLASENMDLQVVGSMDRTRLRNEITPKKKKKKILFILEIVSVCTFHFYASPYKYGRTFTHDTNSCFQSFHFPYILPFLLVLLFSFFLFLLHWFKQNIIQDKILIQWLIMHPSTSLQLTDNELPFCFTFANLYCCYCYLQCLLDFEYIYTHIYLVHLTDSHDFKIRNISKLFLQ